MAGYDSRLPKIVTGHSHVWRLQRGFTMIELIAVLIIIGVLGAIAATRYFDRTSFDADTFTDQTRAMLRYGQKLAVAQNRNVFVRLDGKSVALCFDDDCTPADRIVAPSGANSGSAETRKFCGNSASWFCEAAPSGISYSTTGTAALFRFDALGKPFAASDGEAVSSFVKAVVTIGGDGATRTVTVEPETGYVH